MIRLQIQSYYLTKSYFHELKVKIKINVPKSSIIIQYVYFARAVTLLCELFDKDTFLSRISTSPYLFLPSINEKTFSRESIKLFCPPSTYHLITPRQQNPHKKLIAIGLKTRNHHHHYLNPLAPNS